MGSNAGRRRRRILLAATAFVALTPALAFAQAGPTLALTGDGVTDLSTLPGIDIIQKTGPGSWTLTGQSASPDATILAGDGTPSGDLVFAGTGLTGDIIVNGARIIATTPGAFGSGTIYAVNPTIVYAASGSYGAVVLNSSDPANDPTRLEATAGVVARLTTVSELTAGQPLVIGGQGEIVITRPTSFTGPLTVASGTLSLIPDSRLQGQLSPVVAVTIDSGATLRIAGVTRAQQLGSLSGSGTLELLNIVSPAAVTVGDRNDSTTFSGAIIGQGSFIKVGTGTLTLNGSIASTVGLSIANGTLKFGQQLNWAGEHRIDLRERGNVLDLSDLASFTLDQLSTFDQSIVRLPGTLRLNNAVVEGSLTGGGALVKFGSGTATLQGNNEVGNVTIEGGTLRVENGRAINDASTVEVAPGATFRVAESETVANIRGAGTINIDSLATLTFGGDNAASSYGGFIGGGGISKVGTGTFTLLGANNATGPAAIRAGILRLAPGSSYQGNVSIASGASLIGSGQVGGTLTIDSGATLSPGDAPTQFGTISAGALNTSGTIVIDFGGGSTGGASDRIIVSGPVTVLGGTIDARPVSTTADYSFNQYFALTAGTRFDGRFANPEGFVRNAYDPRLWQRIRYDLGPAAVLEVRYLQDLAAGIAVGTNAHAAALALNSTEVEANDSLADLINNLFLLPPAAREGSLTELSGEATFSGRALSSMATEAFMRTINERLGGAGGDYAASAGQLLSLRARTPTALAVSSLAQSDPGSDAAGGDGLRAWVQGYTTNQRIDEDESRAATRASGTGLALGLELGIDGSDVVGLSAGYTSSDSRTAALRGRTDGESYAFALYSRAALGAATLSGILTYATTTFDTDRTVMVGGASYAPVSKGRADTLAASSTFSWQLDTGASTQVVPHLNATYVRDRQNGFEEKNGGAANLIYEDGKLDRIVTSAGVSLTGRVESSSLALTSSLRAGGSTVFGDRGVAGFARFSEAPAGTGIFYARGARLPDVWATGGASVRVAGLGSRVSVEASYDGAFGAGFRDHRLSGALRIGF